MPSAQDVYALAEKYERAGRAEEALALFEKIAKAVPNHIGVLKKIAKLSGKLGRVGPAMHTYRQIIATTRLPMEAASASVALADLLFETDPDSALAVVREGMTPDHPAEYAERLNTLVRLTEWKARAERGLPVHHALSFDEVPFKFARAVFDEYVGAAERLWDLHPGVPDVALMAACARALAGRFEGANDLVCAFSRLAPEDQRGKMRFGEPTPPTHIALPDVSLVRDIKHVGPTLMISCDAEYLRVFGLPQLRSLAAVAPGTDVHVHYMGDSLAVLEPLGNLELTISCTVENPAAFIADHGMRPIDYYCAVRFVRFAAFLERASVPLWMVDADALVVNDPRPLFATNAGAAARIRAGRVEPWNQFSACMVMGTAQAYSFYQEVANVVMAAMPKPWWGLDQFALYAAYLALRDSSLPPFQLLGPNAASIEFEQSASFWFTAGSARQALRAGTPASPESPNLVRYEKLYRRFS